MNLTYDELLSNVAFNCNLRHYTVELLSRMNGGTNFAAPLRKAEKMFGQVAGHLGARAARLLALITDGRVDSYQAGDPNWPSTLTEFSKSVI